MKRKETREKMKQEIGIIIKKCFIFSCVGMKAIWRSTLSIVSLIVYIFLMNGLMVYFNQSTTLIEPLIRLNYFLMTNWSKFWLAFFLLNLYDDKWRVTQ